MAMSHNRAFRGPTVITARPSGRNTNARIRGMIKSGSLGIDSLKTIGELSLPSRCSSGEPRRWPVCVPQLRRLPSQSKVATIRPSGLKCTHRTPTCSELREKAALFSLVLLVHCPASQWRAYGSATEKKCPTTARSHSGLRVGCMPRSGLSRNAK